MKIFQDLELTGRYFLNSYSELKHQKGYSQLRKEKENITGFDYFTSTPSIKSL